MSASDSNLEKQKKDHRPAIIGISVALILGVLFFGFNAFSAADEDADVVGEELIHEDTMTPATE